MIMCCFLDRVEVIRKKMLERKMSSPKFAPIVLFVYSRTDCLIKTVDALKNNYQADESELYIFSDGPKDGQEEKINKVRSYIRTITGFKRIEIIESPRNKGLANSIISGVTEIVNRYGKIIVLEDDLVTSPYFLKYMNDSLALYENESDVSCLCGYTYPICSTIKERSFFIRGADCKGWGTWKRAWDMFEIDAQKLKVILKKEKLQKKFNFDCAYPYMDMLQDQINGYIDSWAIRWLASAIINNQLCLYPTRSLVQDIGMGIPGSTHCTMQTNYFEVELDSVTSSWEKISVSESKEMFELYAQYLLKLKGTFYLLRRGLSVLKYNLIRFMPAMERYINYFENLFMRRKLIK